MNINDFSEVIVDYCYKNECCNGIGTAVALHKTEDEIASDKELVGDVYDEESYQYNDKLLELGNEGLLVCDGDWCYNSDTVAGLMDTIDRRFGCRPSDVYRSKVARSLYSDLCDLLDIRYILRFRVNGDFVCEAGREIDDAKQALEDKESEDKDLGIFDPDTYEIFDRYTGKVVIDDGGVTNA